jgi:hypothetical protein
MTNNQLINFVEFYFEESINDSDEDEDINFISKELEDAGIDAERSEEKILEMINMAKVEAKIEGGKKFKDEFYKLLGNLKSNMPEIEKEEPELALAFRKLKDSPENEDNDMIEDNVKLKLMEYLKKKKSSEIG